MTNRDNLKREAVRLIEPCRGVLNVERFDNLRDAVVSALDAAEQRGAARGKEDIRIVRELMEWADRCPNAEGKGYIRSSLLPAAKVMLDRWNQR